MKIPKIEITIKYKGAKSFELETITSSADIYNLLTKMYNTNTVNWTEEVILICINNQNKVIGYSKISHGGMSGTVCDPRIIFTIALNCPGTTQIIISHNHPSNNAKPSSADKTLTAKINEAGKMLEIRLLDHIIYTEEGYYSFADEGAL